MAATIRTLLAASLISLTACSEPPPALPSEAPEPSPAPLAAPSADRVSAAEPGVATETEPPPLDLTRDHLDDIVAEDSHLAEAETALPDLFDEETEQRVRLDGRVLTNKDARDLQDTVEGVEMSVEVKTGGRSD